MTQPTMKALQDVTDEFIEGEWGFTGTRAGMTNAQKVLVRSCLKLGKPAIVRHGGAHGADTEFHAIWREQLPQRISRASSCSTDRTTSRSMR